MQIERGVAVALATTSNPVAILPVDAVRDDAACFAMA